MRRCPPLAPLKTLAATFNESREFGMSGGTTIDLGVIERATFEATAQDLALCTNRDGAIGTRWTFFTLRVKYEFETLTLSKFPLRIDSGVLFPNIPIA